MEWVNTPALYSYLKGVGFKESSAIFINSGDYSTEDDKSDFLQLRDNNPKSEYAKHQSIEQYWTDYIALIQNAQYGDLVFYENKLLNGWSHVGIMADWNEPTHKLYKTEYDSEPREPRIFDHDGQTTDLPRSIGDSNTDLSDDFLDIVHVRILIGP